MDRGRFDALFDRIKKAQSGEDRMNVSYAQALREIGFGRKRSHWIWYVIPSHKRIRPTTRKPQFLLPSIEAHRAYLGNEILRKRLMDIFVVTLSHLTNKGKTLKQIYGAIDASKVLETCSMFAIASFLELKNVRYTTKDIAKTMLQLCVGILEADDKKRGVVRLHPKVLRVYLEEASSKPEYRFETTADILRLSSMETNTKDEDYDEDDTTKVQEIKEAPTKPVFEWRESRDKWVPFSEDLSDTFERALRVGKREVRYLAANKRYVLDFTRMKQKNVRSRFERDVRRVVVTKTADVGKNVVTTNNNRTTIDREYEWMWFDGDNWIPYASNIAARLEMAKRKNHVKSVTFSTNHTHRYRVNLSTMTQTNLRTNFSRRVRRVLRGASSNDDDDDDDKDSGNNTTRFVPSPPPAPRTRTFKNVLGTAAAHVVPKATTRKRFSPKRTTGPLRNYCKNCGLHKARHETVKGVLSCRIVASL